MKKLILSGCAAVFLFMVGCAMLTAWKAIPPPGGCNECHTVPINNNWHVAYQAPVLSDEKNRPYFQREGYNMPAVEKPSSSLQVRKGTDENCFECHRAPTPSHKGRMGRFHH